MSPCFKLVTLVALALRVSSAHAQEPAGPEAAAASASQSPVTAVGADIAPTDAESGEAETPVSTEQGKTPLTESFDRRPLLELLRESKRAGLRDTTFQAQVRFFYFDRANFDGSESLACTLGGSAGFKTGYFAERVAIGATGYTSQRLYAPEDDGGTLLLQPGQRPYSVLGELYGEVLLTEGIRATVGRKQIDTPFLNGQDTRMTPNTFDLIGVQGVLGGTGEGSDVRFAAGYVDKMKPRDSESFESMAVAARALAGVERGVYAAGAILESGELSVGAMDYYSADIVNIAYSELRYSIPLAGRLRLQLAGQYADQRSTGQDLLAGQAFRTSQLGLKAELAMGPALLTTAYTDTGNGANMRSPWGGYPGYTSAQDEDFDRRGERAVMLRAAYNFPPELGLSTHGLWVHGSRPDNAGGSAQDEYDLDVQWRVGGGVLKGLKLLARYAHVSRDAPDNPHQDDLRLVLYYDLPAR